MVRGECGKSEANGFEPARGKGAAARAVCYFLLRYPGVVRQYGERPLQTLLAWHAADPPGEWERHRNAAISERDQRCRARLTESASTESRRA